MIILVQGDPSLAPVNDGPTWYTRPLFACTDCNAVFRIEQKDVSLRLATANIEEDQYLIKTACPNCGAQLYWSKPR